MECNVILGVGKRELLLRGPLIAGPEAYGWPPFALAWPGSPPLGAYVTPVMTLAPRYGAERPGLVRTASGFVLHTGRRNPGLRRALRSHGADLARMEVPAIAALYATSAGDVAEAAATLAADERIQGLELHVSHAATPEEAGAAVAAAVAGGPLPCLACVPCNAASACASAAQEAGAAALVIAGSPLGRGRDADGSWVYGPLESPALAPRYVELVHEVAEQANVPIIARGACSPRDALDCVAAGAVALEIGPVAWVDPEIAPAVYAALEGECAKRGCSDWGEAARHMQSQA